VKPLLLALAGLTLCTFAGPADAATRVRTYNPWTADGDPKVRKWFHGSGECRRSSFVNSRPQAWRCVSGNIVLDPCFQSPTDEEVFCVSSPWSRRGHLLSAVLDPDTRGRSPARAPWAMQVGRARCVFIRRSRTSRRRRGPTYKCGSRRNRSFLFGRPNRKRRTWTVRASRDPRGAGARRARVRTAWL
jgi:hypothetical protein